MQSQLRWIEWAARNLAMGVVERKILDELMASGYEEAHASAMLREIRSSPLFPAILRTASDLNKWTSLAEALLELESQQYDFQRIPKLANLSSTVFHRDYYCTNRPVIITDVVEKWPALKKWNLDFFRKEFGNELVRYQKGRSHNDHRDAFIDHTVETHLAQYLDLLNQNATNADYYLIAHDHLLERTPFKKLLGDIEFDSRYFDANSTDGRVFFWLGPPGSMTPMHRDLGNVYMAQLLGRKSVTLIPSKQLHLVYNEHGYHSEVDFENISLSDYPLLKHAFIANIILEPGEILFIPIGWWHHVKSLDITLSITGNNFAFGNHLRALF